MLLQNKQEVYHPDNNKPARPSGGYLCQGGDGFISACVSVSSITQKLPDRLQSNLVKGCGIDQGRTFVQVLNNNSWIILMDSYLWECEIWCRSKLKTGSSAFKCGFIRGLLGLGGSSVILAHIHLVQENCIFNCWYKDNNKLIFK